MKLLLIIIIYNILRQLRTSCLVQLYQHPSAIDEVSKLSAGISVSWRLKTIRFQDWTKSFTKNKMKDKTSNTSVFE